MVERKDNLYNNADSCYKVYSGEEFICLGYQMYQGSFDFPSYEDQFD